MHSITLPNRHDRDTFRCSRQLADNQVLQWKGYVWNQESCITTSGIHLMTIFKHRIVSEQHLVNQNFAPSSRGKQYYSFPRDNITPGWKRYKFISHRKISNKIQGCGFEFRIERHFAVIMGWFRKKKTYTHLWEKTYFRLPYEDATHQFARVERTDFGGKQTYKVLGYRLLA